MAIFDLTGQRFGRLTVTEKTDKRNSQGRVMWRCRCDCGKEVLVNTSNLRRGDTRSCGCLHKEMIPHNEPNIRTRNRRLYHIWRNMIRRCEELECKGYENYGGRGIRVEDEWKKDEGFERFLNWANKNGYDKDAKFGKCTLDRIDTDKNYGPNNCKFSDMIEQGNNRRNNNIIEYNGEKHTLAEWSRITGLHRTTIYNRINRYGWTVEEALTRESKRIK